MKALAKEAARPAAPTPVASPERSLLPARRFAREAVLQAPPGEPLPPDHLRAMSSAFGFDFSRVRVHASDHGDQVASALGRRAVTVGDEIFFARDGFSPGTPLGREVLAHELAHVAQGSTGGNELETVAADDGPEEQAATAAGQQVAAGDPPPALVPIRGSRSAKGRHSVMFCFPGVVPEALAEDRIRRINPLDPTSEFVFTDARGYIRNPSATRLNDVIRNGRVTGAFRNGTFQYVVDQNGEIWVGRRMDQNMPHPTLIGGRDPQVQAAGMLEIHGGEIVRVDNHSGHFRPPRASVREAIRSLTRLPREAIQRLRGESVHFQTAGGQEQVVRRPVRSLRLLLNRIRQIRVTRPIQRLRGRYRHDPRFRSRVRRGAGGAGAVIATLVVGHLIDRWRRQLEEEQIQRDIERSLPEVRRQLIESLSRNSEELDRLVEENPEATVHLNMTFRISHWIDQDPEVGPMENYAGTELVSAGYSLTPAPETSDSSSEQVGCVSRVESTTFTVSEPVPLSQLFEEETAPESPPQPPPSTEAPR